MLAMCPFLAASAAPAEALGQDAVSRSILATVPDAMIVIDDSGAILSFSSAAEAMFGFAAAEVQGQNVKMLMPKPDRDRHDDYLRRYMETGEAHIIGTGRITNARRRDGSVFPIELAVGDAGRERPDAAHIFTGFVRDLTERQQTERRLADLQGELTHISRVSAMGSLAAALAHELNQPLTAIASYMEGASALLDGEEQPGPETLALVREAMAEATAQSLRAGQIVRRLREFISRGDNEKRVEPLRRLVTESAALALTGARETQLEVDIRLDPTLELVLVDRIQVQQVLLNLIRNAVEAMARSPRKRLDIRSHPAPGGMVEVVVADSGPGIAADMAATLFQPFHSNKAQGMGLGLSICRTIIEAQGGRIWAEPSDMGGAAFHFTLLVAEADDG
jgi:two-component system sensor kinase FixL